MKTQKTKETPAAAGKSKKSDTSVPPVTERYSDADLKEFKKIITDKLSAAQDEQDSIVQNQRPEHQALSTDERVDMSLRQQKYIQSLEAALLRIENKTYGVCRATGKLISKERLKAVPHATLAISDASEKQGNEKATWIKTDKDKSALQPIQVIGIEGKRRELKSIKLLDIVIEKQVRTIFDDEPLQELTDSVRQNGVLQPIGVRLVDGKLKLIFGERRVRASKSVMALYKNRDEIPAVVYENITDEEAMEMQITENLNRKDPHPLEEAIAFKRYMELKNITADELAKRLCRRPNHIGARLKLNDLVEDFQKMLYKEQISIKTALTLCKLAPEAQIDIIKGRGLSQGNDGMYTIGSWTLEQYMSDLKKAPFDTKDPVLLKSVGACGTCMHNTAVATSLFPDEAGKSICMNKKCFREKCDISFALKIKEAIADPATILVNFEYGSNNDVAKLEKAGNKVYHYSDINIVTAAKKGDIESGKVLRWFGVVGDRKGKNGLCTIVKRVSSSSRSGKPSAAAFKEKADAGNVTEKDIKTEIQRIEDAEVRKKEIDMEKAFPLMYNLLYENKKFVYNTQPFTDAEKILMIIKLTDKIPFTFSGADFDDDEFFEKQGFKGDTHDPEFVEWLRKNSKKLDGMVNTLSRIFFYSNASGTFSRSENAGDIALLAVIRQYDPEGLKKLEDNVAAERKKRAERIGPVITKLKAQLKDKPTAAPKKTVKKASNLGKGLSALLEK